MYVMVSDLHIKIKAKKNELEIRKINLEDEKGESIISSKETGNIQHV